MCVNPTKQFYPLDEFTGTRRCDYQVQLALYPHAGRMKRDETGCLGCKTCYFYHSNEGVGQPPLITRKLLKVLGKSVKPHHREFLTTPMDAFLRSGVALAIKQVNTVYPLKFNLITKRPLVALHSIEKHADVWEQIDYHVQVIALMDGLLNGPSIAEDVGALNSVADSVSVRIDPFIPGFSEIEDIVELISELADKDVRHVTAGVYSIYKDHLKALDKAYRIEAHWIRGNYVAANESYLRGIQSHEDVELDFFKRIRETCDRVNVTLGVWSSRESCRELSTGPVDGCDLPTAEEIRARYKSVEDSEEKKEQERKEVVDRIRSYF